MKITSPKAVIQVLMTMSALNDVVHGYQSIHGEYTCTSNQNQCVSSTTGELLNPRFIKIDRNVIGKDQCEDLLKAASDDDADFVAASDGYRYFKDLPLDGVILSKLGRCDDDERIPLSRVSETTRLHQDRHVDEAKLESHEYGNIVDEEVVVLFLNDNPDAFFVYGDERVPVECGTRVTFHGGYPHHTEIDDSYSSAEEVKFLGPVTTQDCHKVGGKGGGKGGKGGKGGRRLRDVNGDEEWNMYETQEWGPDEDEELEADEDEWEPEFRVRVVPGRGA